MRMIVVFLCLLFSSTVFADSDPDQDILLDLTTIHPVHSAHHPFLLDILIRHRPQTLNESTDQGAVLGQIKKKMGAGIAEDLSHSDLVRMTPLRKLITTVKKSGYKTIRFPS